MRITVVLIALAITYAVSPPPESHADKPATKVPAAAPAHDHKPIKPPPTRDQLAEYKKHLKAGWALQKAKQWAQAVIEFEAAAKVLDGDQRALAELGWSAMNAGDFVKARKADEQAVQVSVDKK